MKHSTWQLWVPDDLSEQHFYRSMDVHGAAITHINTADGSRMLIEQIEQEMAAAQNFATLSAIQAHQWPIVLLACQTYRLPLPIHFWAMGPGSG